MKKIIFIVALFACFFSSAQPPGYTKINDRYYHLALSPQALGLPAGAKPGFIPGQSTWAGQVYVDTVGGGLGFWWYQGGTWHHAVDSSALADTSVAIRMLANPIDVFVIAGQSNAVGNSGSPSTAIVAKSGTAFQFYNNIISAAVEPIGNSNGSAWGAFANTYYKLTGHLIGFIPVAVNGTSMASAANVGFGTWDTTGTLYDTAIARTNRGMTAFTNGGYNPTLKGVLWCQGETDGDGINRGVINQSIYSAAFAKLIKRFRIDLGKNIAFCIFKTGFRTDTIQTGYSQVQSAQISLANPDSLINIVFSNARDFPARGLMVDNYHYKQSGYNEMGRIGAETYVNSGSRKLQEQAGNVYLPPTEMMGIGTGLPASPIDILNTGVAKSISVSDSMNNVVRLVLQNRSDGSVGGAGTWLYTSLGLRSEIIHSSPSSFLGGDMLVLNSTPGIGISTDSGDVNLSTGVATSNILLKSRLRIKNNGQIAIGSSVDPAASAILDIVSTTKGFRPPTMTGAQMTSISSPATGLLVWCTDSLSLCEYNGSAWLKVKGSGGDGSGTVTSVSAGTGMSFTTITSSGAVNADTTVLATRPMAQKKIDSLAATITAGSGWSLSGNSATAGSSFLGTTNNVSLRVRTNNVQRFVIDSTGWGLFGPDPSDRTAYDGQTTGFTFKEPGNGTSFGITFLNNANNATHTSVGTGGIASDQTIGMTSTSGDLYLNATRTMIGSNTAATSTLQSNGSFSTHYVAKAVDYTLTISDQVVEVTATGKTMTLPTAVGIAGRIYTIKLTASGTGTVATTSSQNIDASTTYSLSAQYKYVTVESNGANWLVIANN